MTPTTEREQWIIVPTNTMAPSTDNKVETQGESQPETKNESNNTDIQTNNNPKEPASEKKDAECTCPVHPSLERSNTVDSIIYDDEVIRSRPRRRAAGIRRYSLSPTRIQSEPFQIPAIQSSDRLLAQVNKMDGIIDLPYPARTSVYLTTFPFTERDIKKYSWLFANGTEDVFFLNSKGQINADEDFEYDNGPYPVVVNARRNRDYYEPMNEDIPLIQLSRALDTAVVPEDIENKDHRYWIVVQNKSRPKGVKLIVAESRKAAGILIYYEALNGNSVSFVGAVVQQRKKGVPLKIKKVESLEEAVKMKEEGDEVVGIVC
jgi:hypothetical protein